MITTALFTTMIMVNIGSTQETVAGPFGNQGHWVEDENGGKVCATHWWLNRCIVNPKDDEIS